ncbi:MAG: hypothetical protein AAGG51_05620 [Cyanobacteria bacterium P01_G01_bin.54]
MTELLQVAIEQLQQLPDDVQDAYAQRLLQDLAERDDEHWDAQFAATTQQQWTKLAEQMRQDIANGDTMLLEQTLIQPWR